MSMESPVIHSDSNRAKLSQMLRSNSVLKQTYTVLLNAAQHPASQWKLASTPCGQLRNGFEQVLPQSLFNSIFLDFVKDYQIPGLEMQCKYKIRYIPYCSVTFFTRYGSHPSPQIM